MTRGVKEAIIISLPVILFFVALWSVVNIRGAYQIGIPVESPTSTATASPTATATLPSPTPTATATATRLPPTATPVPERVMTVLEVYAPSPARTASPAPKATKPPPTAVPTVIQAGDLNQLPLPPGTTVNRSGCASDGHCEWFNFWWHPTSEAVVQPGEPRLKEVHELCHGHQDWSIGRPLALSELDLRPWYSTVEGQSFMAAVDGLPFPWAHSAVNGLEDFAWTCANWFLNPARLVTAGGQARYRWAKENLP